MCRSSQLPEKAVSVRSSVFASQCAVVVTAGRFECLELGIRKQYEASFAAKQEHRHLRGVVVEDHPQCLPLKLVPALLRVTGKRIDRVALIVNDDLIGEFIPDKATTIEASFLFLTAAAGCSSISITSWAATIGKSKPCVSCLASSPM